MAKAWREYQEKAAGFFRELGLGAQTDVRGVPGARASHDIDVLVRFNRFGVEQTWIVECKLHRRKVKKADVLTLQSVVQDIGADRGFLLSESGFQSGAVTAARHSNVDLSDLADLRTNAEADILDLRWSRVFDRVARATRRLSGLVTRTRVGKHGGRIDIPPNMDHENFLWWRAHFGVLGESLQNARVGAFPVAYAFERTGDRVLRTDGLQAFLEKAEQVLDEGERWLAQTEASRAVEGSTGSSTAPSESQNT